MRLLLLILFFSEIALSQTPTLTESLSSRYDSFREASIRDRRFKHADIEPLILSLKNDARFQVKSAGKSIEGRNIYHISLGNGPVQVLLWSQMHGDESTATMALFDLFNFFRQTNEFESYKTLVLRELTLHFIPMLNPDGAEKFQRRNALGIDLNRDALRLQNPESKLLKRVRDEIKADWGFNLHDQNRYYGAGLNPETASISFLAPAYNYEKDVNEKREDAMQLIGVLNSLLQQYIPGKTARYSDDFEPRAFGDNMQKWGTRTILIEAGGLEDDREKQTLRKLHFLSLLTAFQSIAEKSYERKSTHDYELIPFNKSNLFNDLLIREAKIEKWGQSFIVDVAFRRDEVGYNQANNYYFQGSISDMGDLSTSFAYEELDARNLTLSNGKVYPKSFTQMSELKGLKVLDLLRNGYTYLTLATPPSRSKSHLLPFAFLKQGSKADEEINVGKNPCLLLRKNGEVRYVITNGNLFDLSRNADDLQRAFDRLVSGK